MYGWWFVDVYRWFRIMNYGWVVIVLPSPSVFHSQSNVSSLLLFYIVVFITLLSVFQLLHIYLTNVKYDMFRNGDVTGWCVHVWRRRNGDEPMINDDRQSRTQRLHFSHPGMKKPFSLATSENGFFVPGGIFFGWRARANKKCFSTPRDEKHAIGYLPTPGP